MKINSIIHRNQVRMVPERAVQKGTEVDDKLSIVKKRILNRYMEMIDSDKKLSINDFMIFILDTIDEQMMLSDEVKK